MKIRVLFYRAERDGHWLDDGISLWTKLFNWKTKPYSHCEIWWPDADGRFETVSDKIEASCKSDAGGTTYTIEMPPTVKYHGECFTSTMRGKHNGTVIRPAYTVLTHPERWDYCEILVSDNVGEMAKENARLFAENNEGYDLLCILGFFLPWRLRSYDKDICSEVVQKFLCWCRVFSEFKVWSPRRLSTKVIAKGYKIVPLI